MDLPLLSIDLPHWLMIAGAVLVTMDSLDLVIVRNRQVPRAQMPPLPSLIDSLA
ncbi:hypothetical protein [Bradyrhizobium sp. AUGA SZCCT0042]|uniref:hypothetical protein n=1 Tax=Bradyrhizobium sp. AUGA SZCCT0042 TaxID=2807651 RepID=UPI001BADF6EB|nr:hypothetical protein [Bradyrhizobium sp. AUGA SZCCT0042]MBR1302141.1 hypothetical protein [Bradyrhizobium sp. AUGA SZCCT0042]